MIIDLAICLGIIFLMLIWAFCIPWLYRKIKNSQTAGLSAPAKNACCKQE
jgi:hypothetical protein